MTKKHYQSLDRMLKRDGSLTASGVVSEAKKKTSPLHSLFEWDESKAAHKFRLNQARTVIRKMNVFIEEAEEKIVHVPVIVADESGSQEGEYQRVKVVVQQIGEFELAYNEALKKLRAAEEAVAIFRRVMDKSKDDRAAVLGAMLENIKAVTASIEVLH